MTISKTMKRTSKRRRHAHNKGSSSIAPIKSLSNDLLVVEVFARVASCSFIDIFNLKKCCKEFRDAAEDSYVNQHVSLDKFPLIQWFPNEKESFFLNQCKESKNMEALYREGLRAYFNYPNKNIGALDIIKVAAQNGHMEAKYVFGMITVCSEDIELRKQGLEHLRFVRVSKCVIRCRNRVKNLTRALWKNNMMLHDKKSLCNNKSTCKGWRAKKGRWALVDDEDDDYDDINMCEYCRWDLELEFFYGLFNVD
ncbi:unnamed protein product [Lupinus luteus]|uniref:At2g35280-like TPR domain-containing protein n=1 Tax=Lupinus luteus TaxID=3873 RepID=A0AAV1X8L8_LUPLU